jgi:hypothetical protein
MHISLPTYAGAHTHTHTCALVYINTSTYTDIYSYKHIHMHTCVYEYLCVRACEWTCACAHTRTSIPTHMHRLFHLLGDLVGVE